MWSYTVPCLPKHGILLNIEFVTISGMIQWEVCATTESYFYYYLSHIGETDKYRKPVRTIRLYLTKFTCQLNFRISWER